MTARTRTRRPVVEPGTELGRRVVAATHSAEVEAVLAEVIALYIDRHTAKVDYYQRGGRVGSPQTSRLWSRADKDFQVGLRLLAAVLGPTFNTDTRRVTLVEAGNLVASRIPPMCTGWSTGSGVEHAEGDHCPVHSAD